VELDTTESNTVPTYSLRISVLGHEGIERDGKVISNATWQAKSARKLFYYLLFKGPSSREEIGLSIWPDSSTLEMNRKFHSTLSRARNAIGKNVILFDNEHELYSINSTVDVWCDAVEFKAVIQQAKLSSSLLIYTENLWQHAVKLYQGDFLVSFDDIWITMYRESLLELYLQSLVALGECKCVRGNPQEAIEILKQALKVDPYREETHRVLLKCYHLSGERGFIIQHSSELSELFDADLGVTPSLETIKLTRKLLD
jgi:DNA-binding SARP family transcriptional activator